MLLILELGMLIGGIYAVATGKLPSFLIGGGKYQVEGLKARLFGILFIIPLPVAFLGGVILTLLFGEEGTGYAVGLELAAVLGVLILAIILIRFVGTQVEPANNIQATIERKSQGALMYAIFSITGVAALICSPLAIVYANQALKLIDEYNVGEQHRNKAKTARTIAIVATALWGIGLVCFAALLISNS